MPDTETDTEPTAGTETDTENNPDTDTDTDTDTENNADTGNATDTGNASETPLFLRLLKADLNRTGNFPGDDEYLTHLLNAASGHLSQQGVRDDGSDTYAQILVGTAAWIYRKRVTGEAEPQYLRRMRIDYKLAYSG